MVAISYLALFVGFIGAVVANPTPPSGCVPSNAEAIVKATKTRLPCDEMGASKPNSGLMQYSCQPFGTTKGFELDVIVKISSDATTTSHIQSLTYTNKVAANKIFSITTNKNGATGASTTSYYSLQGQGSCVVAGDAAASLGGWDPASIFVYDMNIDGSKNP